MDLSSPLIAIFLVAAVLLFWAVGAHNRLVALRSRIGVAWLQVEETLQRRHALLERLVASLREPLQSQPACLDAVLAASAQTHAATSAVRPRPSDAGAVASLVVAEKVLTGALLRMRAAMDSNVNPPTDATAEELKNMRGLHQQLTFRRQVFNQASHAYNDAVRQFPTNLLTPLFRFDLAGTL